MVEELQMEVVLHTSMLHIAAAAERHTAAAHRQAGSHWGHQAAPHERQALAAGLPYFRAVCS